MFRREVAYQLSDALEEGEATISNQWFHSMAAEAIVCEFSITLL